MSENINVDPIIHEDATQSEPNPSDKQSKQEQINLFSSLSVSDEIELRKIDMLVLDNQQERALRKKYAARSYWFSVVWAAFIATFILLKGFGYTIGFDMEQAEFLTVIGALSATILTYYTIVIRFLFPSKKNK